MTSPSCEQDEPSALNGDTSEFDPDYFREVHPAWDGIEDETCRCAWLHGSAAGTPGTARAHLAALGLPGETFPAAFPWRYYARLRPQAGAHRWAALDDLVSTGFKQLGPQLPFGGGAKDFLVDLARSYAGRSDALSVQAFELAALYGALSAEEIQHWADSSLRDGHFLAAAALYEQLMNDGTGTIWTLRNFVQCSISLRQWNRAEQALAKASSSHQNDSIWQTTLRDLIAAEAHWSLTVARARYADGERSDGDAVIVASVDRSAALLTRFSAPQPPASVRGRRVILFANIDDDAARAYRVVAKVRLLEALGVPSTVIPIQDSAHFEEAMADAAIVLFFHVPALPHLLSTVLRARALGLTTVYEADVPVFDSAFAPPPLQRFRGFLASALHDELKLEPPLCRAFASHCDYGLAATTSVADRLASLVRNRRAFVLGDGPRTVSSLTPVLHEGVSPTLLLCSSRFLYLDADPGSPGRALHDFLRRRKEVQLITGGYVKLAPAFDEFDSRITELDSIDEALEKVSAHPGFGIALGLSAEDGDDAHPIRGWVDAAALAIPSVLLLHNKPPPDLVHGETALVATDVVGFGLEIDRALSDAEMRRKIGMAARAFTNASRSDATLSSILVRLLSVGQAESRL